MGRKETASGSNASGRCQGVGSVNSDYRYTTGLCEILEESFQQSRFSSAKRHSHLRVCPLNVIANPFPPDSTLNRIEVCGNGCGNLIIQALDIATDCFAFRPYDSNSLISVEMGKRLAKTTTLHFRTHRKARMIPQHLYYLPPVRTPPAIT